MVEPLIGASLGVLVVGWVLGGLATRRVDGLGRLILVAIAAAAIGFALLMPASLGLIWGDADWSLVGGTRSVSDGELGLSQLFRMATGPHGASAMGWALLVLPALALVLAFGQRLAWAARCWVVIVGSVGLAWFAEQSDLTLAVSDPHVLLAPAGMSLSFAAGVAAMAFQRDLRRYRFGWRQAVPFFAGAAVIVSVAAGLGGAVDGRWQAVNAGYESVFSFFDQKAPAHARTFWLGEADVMPVNGWRYDDELTFAVTQARTPTVLDYSPGNPDSTTLEIRSVFEDTLSGASSRLGQRLALYGIRYVVVVEANAPAPFSTIQRPVDPLLKSRLTEQLDLVRVEVRPGATIYENRAYVPTVIAFAPGVLGAVTAGTAPSDFSLALPEVTSLRSYRGAVEPGEIYVATAVDSNWSLRVDGVPQERLRIFDWAQLFVVDRPGVGTLTHSNEQSYWLGAIAQVIVWVVLLTILVLGRRREP